MDVLQELEKAILSYDKDLAASAAKRVVAEDMDLLKAMDLMTATIRKIGDGFGRGELWLPDLVGGSAAMSSALPIIEEALKEKGQSRKALGVIVLGTVLGDIHTIGKAMVGTLLTAAGFNVIDVGINVKPEEFVQAVIRHEADILAMSALMTMTAPEQRNTIELLEKEGIRSRVKVMVGGGAITQAFADEIGADGYDATAPGAMHLARRLMGKEDG